MNRLAIVTGLALLGMLLSGCSNNVKEENALLLDENESLRAQIGERNSALEAAHDDLRDKDLALAELRQDLSNAGDASRYASTPVIVNEIVEVDPFGGIEGVTGEVSAGEITAILESDVLFDSGKTKLKSNAKRSLDQVAVILKNDYSTKSIRVSGYTDTDPIKKSGYKSNYHLGFERAYAVREYLISRGVSNDQVYVASFGPDHSRGSKQESRRVEIAVVLAE